MGGLHQQFTSRKISGSFLVCFLQPQSPMESIHIHTSYGSDAFQWARRGRIDWRKRPLDVRFNKRLGTRGQM